MKKLNLNKQVRLRVKDLNEELQNKIKVFKSVTNEELQEAPLRFWNDLLHFLQINWNTNWDDILDNTMLRQEVADGLFVVKVSVVNFSGGYIEYHPDYENLVLFNSGNNASITWENSKNILIIDADTEDFGYGYILLRKVTPTYTELICDISPLNYVKDVIAEFKGGNYVRN